MRSEDRRSTDQPVPRWVIVLFVVLAMTALVLYATHDRTAIHWASREWWRGVIAWLL